MADTCPEVTKLMIAARDSSEEVARALAARGTSPASINRMGESATGFARLAADARVLEFLPSYSRLLPEGDRGDD